ncbi:T9SS type A sorting domain-containing protein [Winogradskyella litoriviva]|uniref:T9SS type A sorting domain-containing protein n=1 Tax=Winogradskyella litoriviva TaxID=1220182 RepID=A0ABX2E2K6_9FLAO|nr:T9SS type A sorting domain-containing protein [Winogradskyella litoriviva]NRD22724.1 T9SS type A sorting domain-containing protein [Winogradskyella litoriviva]
MKKKIFGFFIIILLSLSNVSAQETFKVMFYNLLNYPLEDAVPNRINDLAYILYDYQPDLFLVCELNNISGAVDVLTTAQAAISPDFDMATYVSNTSDDTYGDQNDLQNLLLFDSTKFTLEEEIIVPTSIRDFNIYRLKLNTINQDTNPIELYVIVCHLKASSGTTNAQKRYEMVQDLEAYLNTLPVNTNVLLGGDLNLYTSSETAFQTLINTSNHITFVDPANRVGSWHNNSNYIDVFSQSTRTQTGMGGTTGGFDDRFDFILTSENMLDTADVTYVPDTYRVYGNNGLVSCWNKAINSSDCETTGSQFSYTLRNHLHNFSDHLPITLSLETTESFLDVNEFETTASLRLDRTLINDILTVNFPLHMDKQTLIIYNSLGQKVKTFKTNLDAKQYFNVSNLQTGLYYLKLNTGNFNPIKFIIE